MVLAPFKLCTTLVCTIIHDFISILIVLLFSGRLRLARVVNHDSVALFDSGSKLRAEFAEAYLASLALSMSDILEVIF